MTEQHPITPPDELVQQWVSLACEYEGNETWIDLASQAARWGDEQRLEACIAWLHYNYPSVNCVALRAAMRPKPPSLAVRALIEFESHQCAMETNGCDTDLLRAALKRLQQLEQESND